MSKTEKKKHDNSRSGPVEGYVTAGNEKAALHSRGLRADTESPSLRRRSAPRQKENPIEKKKTNFEVAIAYHGTRIRELDIRYAFTPYDDPRRIDKIVFSRKNPDSLQDRLETHGPREWIMFCISIYGSRPETPEELSVTAMVYCNGKPLKLYRYPPPGACGNALGAHIVYAPGDSEEKM